MAEKEDLEDLHKGINTAWAVTFGVLYFKSMLISLACYLLLFRSIALSTKKNNPTLLCVVFLFFCYLVDMGLEMEELINLFSMSLHTTANCRLVTYTTYGNKILQAMIVMFMLYYNLMAGYFKTYKFEVVTMKMFPLVILGLLLLELLLVIHPAMRVEGHESGKYCIIAASSQLTVDSWFYTVLLPYWFPLVFSLPPTIYMILRYREKEYNEPRKTQVKLTVCIAGAFFLSGLLYYLLMLAREIEAATVTRSEWQHLLGASVWYITRPMFAYISYAFHIAVPLICLTQDPDLKQHLPTIPRRLKEISLKKRKYNAEEGANGANSANGTVGSNGMAGANGTVGANGENGFVNKSVDFEDREYHNSAATNVVCIG